MSLFSHFTRVKTEHKDVATVTEENAHLLAAFFKGAVDYTEGEPVLVLPLAGETVPSFKARLGSQVEQRSDGGWANANGFNNDSSWAEDEDDEVED